MDNNKNIGNIYMEQEIITELEQEVRKLIPIDAIELTIHASKRDSIGWSPDFSGHIKMAGRRFELAFEAIPPHRISLLPDFIHRLKAYTAGRVDLVPVIVGRYLSPQRQKQCKEAGINFIDLSGNVFLHQESVYVERVGFPNRFPEIRKGRGPFSDKASLILRALLAEAERVWGVRDMAKRVGLDPGFVSRMARELESRRYVTRADSKIRLLQPKLILEDWVRDYNYRKNRMESCFCLADSPEGILSRLRRLKISDNFAYALGLHAGAALVAPHAVYGEVHIYVSSRREADFFKEKLKLRSVSQGANVVLLFPYYKKSVFWGARERDGLQVVSDLQLFLDLYNYPLRGREQAEHLYEKRLKAQFED